MTMIEPTRTRRPLLGALVTIVALLACAWGAGSAQARMEIGVEDQPVIFGQSYYNRDSALDRSKAFGAKTLRLEVYWGDYRRYGFAPYDAVVSAAAVRGIRTQITITGTPRYDPRGDQGISWRNPNVKTYAGFVTNVVSHFKGRVFRYSIWNEPNMCYFLSKSSCSYSRSQVKKRAEIYRTLYRAGSAAAKKADRRVQVLIGELAPLNDPLGFLGIATKFGLRADGAALHPYELVRNRRVTGISSTPSIKRYIRGLASSGRLRKFRGGGAVPIYFTEFGYVKGYGGIRTEKQRASKTVAAFRYAKRQGIRQMVYYHLVIPAPGFPRDPFGSGILTSTGGQTLVYKALVKARRSIS